MDRDSSERVEPRRDRQGSTFAAEHDRELPSGDVTFVFTDIEGSTRILKRRPDTAVELFERHDELVRAALRAHRGHEIGKEGDAFFAAFDDVDDALAACADAQRRLAGVSWPTGGEIRVRMGVHCGLAAPRNDNYVAMAVHQAARVVSAANGGQIVVTDRTLRSAAPDGAIRPVPLGRYRIRDFDEPVLLYRVDVEGAPVCDRPVRATPADHHNLTRPATSFVGRDETIAEIVDLLRPGRVLSLVGPGGSGKTRLATETGLRVQAGWHDGVWMVALADVADSSLVADAVADAVRAPRTDAGPWSDVLAWAEERQALVVFDNVEHHLDVCGRLLTSLMACPGIAAVTTTREPLHIAGEVVFRVPPLETAGPDELDDAIRSTPAVQLFVDRARERHPAFDAERLPWTDLARLCRRLDGLPLSIEIAAALVDVLTVREIVDGLDDRFALLRTHNRSLPARQRTLRDLLAWSYDLLAPAERSALRRLAVFGGAFTIEAAVATVADDDVTADEVPELVWALVDKSLAVAVLAEAGTRYRLLETVRAFADDLLADAGDGAATARRAASWFLERVGPWLTADRGWIGAVADDLTNLRTLVDRLASVDQETAQALACSLARYHDAVQSYGTGIDELRHAVDRLGVPSPTRVAMLTALADLHLRRSETTEAERLLVEAAGLRVAVGQPVWNDVAVERSQGELLCRNGETEQAAALATSTMQRTLSVLGEARMNNLLGIARYADGDLPGAFSAFERELELYASIGHDANIASAHSNLAEIALQLGATDRAAAHQSSCLELALAIGQPVMLAYSSLVAARLAADRGDWALAARLLGSAESELAQAGITLYPVDQEVVAAVRTRAEDRLGADAVAEADSAGAGLGPAAAAELARTVLDGVRERRSPDVTPSTDETERTPS